MSFLEVRKVCKYYRAGSRREVRALEEVSSHWDSVYRAMRRAE